MSVESKVKELLEKVTAKTSVIEEEAGPMVPTKQKDSTIKAANSGDSSQPRQGDSQDASHEDREETAVNQGAITAKGISKNTIANIKSQIVIKPNKGEIFFSLLFLSRILSFCFV